MSKEFKEIRHKALRLMLRPIVRFWLESAETIQEFIDVLKNVFVEIAQEELDKRAEKVNVSRVSIMTGVHRPDVSRILNEEAPPKLLPDVVSRIIGQWEQDSDFSTKAGKPRVLSFSGQDSEFAKLVARVSRAIAPGTALFELERSGAVERTKRGLKLVRATQRHTRDFEDTIELLSEDIETLISAVQQNIKAQEQTSPNVHMRTEYDNVFVRDLPEIREWLRDQGKRLHKETRAFLAQFDKDIVEESPRGEKDEQAGGTVILGTFTYIDED